MKSAILILSLAISTSIFAQTKPTAPEVCDNVPDVTGLTGCEKVVIEGFQTKQQLIQAQYQALLTQSQGVANQLQSVIKMIEEKNPGKTYAQPDVQHPLGQLIPKKTEPSKK